MEDKRPTENYLSTYQDFIYEGQARCDFEDGLSDNVNFTLQMMTNGRIVGELQFLTFSHGKIKQQYNIENIKFRLNGHLKDSKVTVLTEHCSFSTLSIKYDISQGTISLTGKPRFSTSEVSFYPENKSVIPRNEVLVIFGLVNFYGTDGVVVNANMGKIELSRNHTMKKLADIARLFGIPLITSNLRLTIQPSGSRLADIIIESTKVIDNFLKITSLSQTTWHEWAFFIVYERKESSQEYRQIYRQLRTPKAKNPISRQLFYDFRYFIETAWEGYSEALEDKFGFGLALEWYVESNSGILETKFLNAATCLELLMDKFHSQQGTDMLFDNDIVFGKFCNAMKEYAKSLLEELKLDENKRRAVYSSMTAMKRRPFVDKCEMLLKYWGISYADTGITIDEIVHVRNKITHEGRFSDIPNVESVSYLWKVYNGLFNILARILLAMLKYRGQYFDAPNDRWINFADVCTGVGSTSI
jgi:hypothetical protein